MANRELQALYDRCGAADLGVPFDEFTRILTGIAATYLGADVTLGSDVKEAERSAFYRSLHLEDLILARACLAGHEKAWETLVERYRHKLFLMACGISKNEGAARELADSLFAELFGIRGIRSSKLASYQGRASLEHWLRALLAREHIDKLRAERRFVPLEDTEPPFSLEAKTEPEQSTPLLAEAIDAALVELNSEQRFLLAAYYLDGRKMAELGRLLALHETTIGRRIEKALETVRKRTRHHLRRSGISVAAAEKLLHGDLRELEVDVRNRLLVVREA